MNYDLLSPISDRLVEDVKLSHFQTFGRNLKLHTSEIIPNLDKIYNNWTASRGYIFCRFRNCQLPFKK